MSNTKKGMKFLNVLETEAIEKFKWYQAKKISEFESATFFLFLTSRTRPKSNSLFIGVRLRRP